MRTVLLIAFILTTKLFVYGFKDKTERISIQKCREYSKLARKPCTFFEKRDNEYAGPKEFPHMALIGHGDKENLQWTCSGSLISNQFILSVAHCAFSIPTRGKPKWIRLGDLNISSTIDDAQIQDFNITEIYIHPNFSRPSVYNDMALIKLDKPVEFNDYVRPACLANIKDDSIKEFTITGWGDEFREPAHMKQDKNIQIVPYETCDKAYDQISKRRLENGIDKELQLCAQPSKTTTCQITSGAPLQYKNKNLECTYNIIGLLSTGLARCSTTPEIYTKVPGYIDWIESIVWPNQ